MGMPVHMYGWMYGVCPAHLHHLLLADQAGKQAGVHHFSGTPSCLVRRRLLHALLIVQACA
jgi:hypothetical protein